jgi:deazaflavin-dependent oxidoreductase (nitroreductase family)
MSSIARRFNAIGGKLMARSGRIAILGTTGAKSGKRREAPVGILRRPDGAIVIAAGGDGRGWPANLRAHPTCTLDIKGTREAYVASLLEGAERDDAIRAFVAAMGRVASNTKWTDVFVLRGVADADDGAVADGEAGPAAS